jgi:hypothetical protein
MLARAKEVKTAHFLAKRRNYLLGNELFFKRQKDWAAQLLAVLCPQHFTINNWSLWVLFLFYFDPGRSF